MITHKDGGRGGSKRDWFRKCSVIHKLTRLADRFIAGETEREVKDGFWVFRLSN